MPPVLHRYLGRDLLQYWLLFTLVLWLVLVAARLSVYLQQAASGLLPPKLVLLLLALKSIGFFVFLMPLALFLGLLWLLGRLNRDNESLALLASGAGPMLLYRAVALPALLVAVLVAVLSAYLVPMTADLGYRLRASAERDVDLADLTPGRFYKLRGGDWLLMALAAGTAVGELQRVFVHARDATQPQVLVAARARVETRGAARYLVLFDGRRYVGTPGRGDYRVLRFREYGVSLNAVADPAQRRRDAVTSAQLWRAHDPVATAELQTRLSRPLSVLVLTLLAVPLARYRPGRSRFQPLWLGVLVFALYFNLMGVAQLWVAQQRVPAWPGVWWVHLLFAAIGGGVLAVRHRRGRHRGAT
jgi:lipopolysaccharide export system permease protein